ncbi:spore germination protein (amino acid permease) [Hydrogenispora ethanolica]|uniref:Spore germination protein (Amino acid permease) n=1 Tax=Hydrogenispora ethanolica TaxID=1082276 RepID=A0A4R1QNH2_HYDET|nr:endospore germination permease [Hydrogenispora ethanolica]TCL53825.1 spore germination protein (amino acid permease) [Hydrogenispora ethanolica]
MIREGRIGLFEAVALLLWPTLGKIFLSYSSGIIQENLSAAWLVVLAGCLLGLIFYLPLAALLTRFPGEDLTGIAERAAGPVIGKMLSGILIVYFFISTVLLLRQIAETVIGTALPQFPLLVVIILLAAVMALPAGWGLEPTARVAALATPFLLIGGIGIFLLQYGNLKLDYLAPFWGPGLREIAANSLARSSLVSEVVFLGFLAPFLPRQKKAAAGFYLIALAGILLTGAMLIGQMVFPPGVAAEHSFPFYEISRSIYFGRFYQRVEFIFVLVWLTITMLSLSLRFYFTAAGVAKVFKMPYYQPLIGIMAFTVLAAALLLHDYNTAVFWDNLIQGRLAWIPAFLIPALIYLIAAARGKHGKQTNV